jgi:hypothetical protein
MIPFLKRKKREDNQRVLTLFWLDFPWINRNMVQPKVLTILHLINAPQISFHDQVFFSIKFFLYHDSRERFIRMIQVFFNVVFLSFLIFSFKIQFFLQLNFFFFSILPYIGLLCPLGSFNGFWEPHFVLPVFCFLIYFFIDLFFWFHLSILLY